MNKRARACVFGLLLATAAGIWLSVWWKRNAPRRDSLHALAQFEQALRQNNSQGLLDFVIFPGSLAHRTRPEQVEFLNKVLRDEISVEGIKALRRHGTFGPLAKVFPKEARQWAAQAAVDTEECVAFRAHRNGVVAEAVLVKGKSSGATQTYRIIRCNNIKQLAEGFLNVASQ